MGDRPVAIITGGGTGVGAASARALAQRGYDVLVNYAHSVDAAELVAGDLRALGGEKVRVAVCDVDRLVACAAFFREGRGSFRWVLFTKKHRARALDNPLCRATADR